MPRLRSTDLFRLTQALEVLHADVEPDNLFGRLFQAAMVAISCENACFDGLNSAGRIGPLGAFPGETFSAATFPILQLYLPEYPLFTELILRRESQPMRTSDRCDMPGYFRGMLFNEFYRPVSLTHQLIVGLDAPEHGWISCYLNRRRDFTETERTLLGLLVPHFHSAARHARTVATLRQSAAATHTVHDFGLTPRESAILEHIAQGLSDKEIGQRCGISVRTVQNHLQNIYSKLGVTSRTAALTRRLALSRQ